MSRRSDLRTVRAGLLVAAACFAAAPARAQAPPPVPPAPPAAPPPAPPAAPPADAPDPKIAEAREAFRIGSTLAKQAQWTDALAAFERSSRLRPHAVTTYNIGFCERALGRFTRARQSLSRALGAPANELPADLATEARSYLAEIEQRVARAVVTLTKPGAVVSIDGRPLEASGGTSAHPTLIAGTREPGPAEAVAAPVFDLLLDPGTHVLVVGMPGVPDNVVTRDFGPGTTTALTLSPAEAPKAQVIVKQGGNAARRTGAIVAFAMGGAFAVAGGVFGGLALKDKSQLDGKCVPKNKCPPDAQGTIDELRTFSNVSTVGFVAAGVGVVTGIVLLATSGDSAAPRKAQGAAVTPWIGPGLAGVRGTF